MICTWMNFSDHESELAKRVHFDWWRVFSLWWRTFLLFLFEHISEKEKCSSLNSNLFWLIFIELSILVNNVSCVEQIKLSWEDCEKRMSAINSCIGMHYN